MSKKINIDQQVNETLESLEGIQKASPGHFFFTRVQARLHKAHKDVWDQVLSFISRPAVVMATVILILLIDVIALTNTEQSENMQATEKSHALDEEYDFSIATIYDYSKPDNK